MPYAKRYENGLYRLEVTAHDLVFNANGRLQLEIKAEMWAKIDPQTREPVSAPPGSVTVYVDAMNKDKEVIEDLFMAQIRTAFPDVTIHRPDALSSKVSDKVSLVGQQFNAVLEHWIGNDGNEREGWKLPRAAFGINPERVASSADLAKLFGKAAPGKKNGKKASAKSQQEHLAELDKNIPFG